MRFLANGPSIPDDLLIARDAGDVIFFCGAGVSRHRANLPDFLKLGGDVIDLLGASQRSLARKLFARIRETGPMEGVGGLIATDRIFGLLEREFDKKIIQAAVAQALRPTDPVDVSAHQTLIELSRGRDGTVRLVTTNFDLLFEACIGGLVSSGPPVLPDPRSSGFSGVIHLHGQVNGSNAAASGEEFVLSSADFGRAYLSDGWATRFMQALLARFQIVFVGYAADDPPIHYLLEALNLRTGNRSRLYAFQAGNNDDDTALWEHRGVRAISFDNSKSFDPLWDSLAAWAGRARDVDGWYDRLLAMASGGPCALDPHIRGQVAHMLSTREGARRVSIGDRPLPASCLLAMDRDQRFGDPGLLDPYDPSSLRIDPYESLALDFDTPPQPVDDEFDFRAERKIPDGSWDAFLLTRLDQDEIGDHVFANFCGSEAPSSAALNGRLYNIGIWFTRVAHQPIALWWAAGRGPLHATVINPIQAWLRQDPKRWPDDIRRGWRLLIAAWADRRVEPDRGYFELKSRAVREGWSEALVRDYAALFKPRITVHQKRGIRHPLAWTDADRPRPVLSYDVDYPHPYEEFAIPDEYLAYSVTRFRENLDLARSLEAEVSGVEDIHIETTRASDGEPAIAFDSYGVTGPVAQFQRLMDRLVVTAPNLARAELARWPVGDGNIFARLRIWAAASPITSSAEAAEILLGFPDEVFWGSAHQRDLLYALRDRWVNFATDERARIEERLRTTSYPWTDRTGSSPARASAHHRLDRLQWLTSQGLAFTFDIDDEMAALRSIAEGWTERSGAEAADSNTPVVRRIHTDTSPHMLIGVPIGEILDRAREAGQAEVFDYFEPRPFTGLAKEKPKRALAALSYAARRGEVPAYFWSEFLAVDQRKDDPPRLVRAIAGRLWSLPTRGLSDIAYPVAEWLRKLGDRVFAEDSPVLDCLWEPLIAALPLRVDKRKRGVDSSWANDALNAPVGKLIDQAFKDPSIRDRAFGQGLPSAWTTKLEQLLGLPGDMRRHALVMLGYRADWLFAISPAWTENHLLSVVDDLSEDSDALWDGILGAARVPSRALYKRLKNALLARAMSPTRRRAEANVIAGFLLIGWGGDPQADLSGQLVASTELREILVEADDDLRIQTLRHFQHWTAAADGDWPPRLLPFLTNVWPNHRALRTPEISARLTDIAMVCGDLFPQVVAAIVPRLVPLRGGILDSESNNNPVKIYPVAALDLLWAILGEDSAQWPFKIEEALEILSQAPDTRADPRLSELRRRRFR
jgi:hypothetical protein